MELGVHSYVDKPVTMDKLKNTLEKIDEELKKRPNKTDVEHEKVIRNLRLSLNAIVEMINDSNTEKWEEETKKNPDADEESRKKSAGI